MPITSNKLIRNEQRRTRPERWYWGRDAIEARHNPLGTTAQAVTRPYLLAHPEREIAYADPRIGVAYCAACDITYKAPDARGYEHGLRITAAYRFIHEHNALIHPRRAARLTK